MQKTRFVLFAGAVLLLWFGALVLVLDPMDFFWMPPSSTK
jgi:hypothetical protein